MKSHIFMPMIGLFIAVLSLHRVQAQGQVICPHFIGAATRPAVSDAKTAMGIYLAIEQNLSPHMNAKRFPDVGVTDEGKAWLVFRWRRSHSAEGAQVAMGGNQLQLHIAKCDGAILDVNFLH